MLVYLAYAMTVPLLMLKSRLGLRICADNSKMFGTQYMSYMANTLCESLIKKCNVDFKKSGGIYSESRIVSRKLLIEPYQGI